MSSPDPDPVPDRSSSLSRHAHDLYKDQRLMPMLRQLVRTSCRLADAMGGSISIVDADAGRYTKVAELGAACQLGKTFPLHEGVTGQVMMRRGPVVLRTYHELVRGHMADGHPAADGAVAALPIWWRGDIVAVSVIFAGDSRRFSSDEVDHLELVTQIVAPGLVSAIDRELPARSLRRRPSGDVLREQSHLTVPAANGYGANRVVSVGEVVLSLLSLAERAPGDRTDPASQLQVTVVGRGERPRLLLHQDGPEPSDPVGTAGGVWHELVDGDDGAVAVQRMTRSRTTPAGTSLSPDPLADDEPESARSSPFSAREHEVATLLARGLSDRAVAAELCLSPKTVEKHVGAVLRKTGTASRTAAVVHCIERGWLQASISGTA